VGELGIAVERQDGVTRLDVAGEFELASAPADRCSSMFPSERTAS